VIQMTEVKQGMKIILTDSKDKIKKQIKAIEYVLKQDTSEKDKQYHNQALAALKEGFKALEKVEVKVKSSGRKKTIDNVKILELKDQGKTQQEIAQILNVSIASVTRVYRESRENELSK